MYCNFNYLKGSPCVFGRAELASAMCSGCWDYVSDFPFQKKKNKGNVDCWLHSHCCLLPHQFWTGSKLCSSGGSATSRLYYFVTLARLLLLLCYYPYKKQTILYIAANNFLDHDLILFRIYSARGGFLRVMMGYFQVGTNASGMARPCPCLPTPGILGTENFSYGPIFLVSRTVRNGSADLRNGSERFCRPQVCTEIFLRSFHPPPKKRVKSSSSCCAFSKPSKEPPCGSKGQGYKRKRSQKNDKGKGTSLPKSLNRQCKGMLSTREKVKLDVDYNLQKAGSFSAVCSWKGWPLSKFYLS